MKAQAAQQQVRIQPGPALRAFFGICEKWQCKTGEMMTLLGLSNRSTFFNYKKNPDKAKLQQDTLERISYILNIHTALRIMFSNPDSIYNWVRKPNTNRFFEGKSAMDKMLGGRVMDIHDVMMFLNARRGGWA